MTRTRRAGAVTVALAGVDWQLRCVWRKPLLWARELHPHFVCDRPARVAVRFVFERAYWSRPLPWIGPDTVRDEPVVRTRAGVTTIRSAFYRARLRGRRADVALAAGFQVDAVMRALCGVSVARRGGVLVRGLRLAAGDGGQAAAGDGGALVVAPDASNDALVAALPGAGHRLHVTPFGAGPDVRPDGGVRARAIYVVQPGTREGGVRVSPARALSLLAPHVVGASRTAGALGRVARLVAGVPCFVVPSLPAPGAWERHAAA